MPPAADTLIAAPREELCLDYANTLAWRGSPVAVESLRDCAGLLQWCGAKLGYAGTPLRALEDWAHAQPQDALHLFDLAIATREALHRIFRAVAAGVPVAAPDLAALNYALAEAPRRGELVLAAPGYVWRSAALRPTVPSLLAPVLWSAADLMTRVAPQRVRLCANPKCLWLFVDASKSGTRRWCEMNSCGNRAKAQRHYQRNKKAGTKTL